MGWRFRKSFKLLPGLRFNVSKSGVSTSVGRAPFTMNIGSRGTMYTTSLPGTGLQYRTQRSGRPRHRSVLSFTLVCVGLALLFWLVAAPH